MFKKLVAILALCLSTQFICAETTETLIDNIQIEKTLLNNTYIDDEYVVNVAVYQFKNLCLKNADCLYSALASIEGKKRLANNSSECPQCSKDPAFTIKTMLHVPQESLLVVLEKDQKGASFIEFYNASKALQSTTIKFITTKNMEPRNIKKFLSSSVAKKAFEKAGITLTKEQIASMVEIK